MLGGKLSAWLQQRNEKKFISLAEKYPDPPQFVEVIEKMYKFLPSRLKAGVFVEIGIVLYQRSYFDLALHTYESALQYFLEHNNKEGESECYTDIGVIYEVFGDYAKAIEFSEKALTIKKQIGDKEGESICYINQGNGYLNLGDYAKAIEFQEKALKIAKEIGSKLRESTCYLNLSLVYSDLGDKSQAIELQEKALKIAKEIGDKHVESVCYVNLGRTFSSSGDFAKAIEFQEKALLLKNEIGDKEGESKAYGNLGVVYENLGDYAKAIEFQEKALKIAKEIGDKYGESKAFGSIGTAYINLGLSKEGMEIHQTTSKSIEYLGEALRIAIELGDKYEESTCYGNLGLVYAGLAVLDSGDYAKATEFLDKALKIARELGSKDLESTWYRNLGLIYHMLDDYAKATEFLDKALKIAKEIGNLPIQGLLYSTLGMIHYDNNKLDVAYDYLRLSIELDDAIGGKILEEKDKISFFGLKSDAFALIVPTCLALGMNKKGFEYTERSKSKTFLNMLATSNIRHDFKIMTNEIKSLLTNEEKFIFRLHEIQTRYLRNKNVIVEPGELDGTLDELNKIYDKLEKIDPEYVSIRRARTLSVDNIQKILSQKENAVLVEFFLTEDKTFIFVISHNDFHVETIELSLQKLEDYLRTYEREVVKYPSFGYIGETWLDLSNFLILPISDYLSRADLIYFVPYGILHYIPLHALELGGEPLIKNHAIIYSPSASLIQFYNNKGSGKLNSCACFGVGSREENYTFLQEAKEVASLFNGKVNVDPTKSLVCKNIDNDILHFACHGEFASADPLSSGIMLYDGMLTAREFLNLRLSSELVTLSACETGISETKSGDELIGLTRALIYAGAASMIVTLWSVYDPSTRDLIIEFYRHLKDGKSKAASLQQAQRKIMQKKEYSHPYYWAPFVLVGDWQ